MEVKTDDYSRHEALDRTSMLRDMIGSYLQDHEYISADADLAAKVAQAGSLLSDVYQEIGLRHLAADPPPESNGAGNRLTSPDAR